MKYEMRLHNEPYTKVKEGTKTVELRLNDEKRSILKVGDIITFTNRITLETMDVKITDLKLFDSFEQLYKNYNKIEMGYNEEDEVDPKDMEKYYSKEDIKKYGVLAIEIRPIISDLNDK